MNSFGVCSILLVLISFICASFVFIKNNDYNNVCKTFDDYYTNRDQNKNCYYNPDYKLEVPDIIRRLGYQVETHKITTEDGYGLTVFRIPSSNNNSKPIFLQHGLSSNSAVFITTGKASLSFVLADAGYDVWLGNFRGTKYSKRHIEYHHNNTKFWDFTIDEVSNYDLRSQLNLVNSVTGKKVIYIGYSLGTTMGFMYGTTHPDEALSKIERFVAIAPMVYLNEIRLSYILNPIWTYVKFLFRKVGNGEFYIKPKFPNVIYETLCLPYPIQIKMCQFLDDIVVGSGKNQHDPETLPIILQSHFDASAILILDHYLQISTIGKFQRFDYGIEENQIRYGSPKPPLYNLSKFQVPLFLIAASNDLLATPPNVQQLHRELPRDVVAENYVVEDFNHPNLLTGKDSKRLVFDVILEFISKNLQ